MNPWRKLFIEGDRMDLKEITPEQLTAGMSCCGVAYQLRHEHIKLDKARDALRFHHAKCHEHLRLIIDRCLTETPDTPHFRHQQHPTSSSSTRR